MIVTNHDKTKISYEDFTSLKSKLLVLNCDMRCDKGAHSILYVNISTKNPLSCGILKESGYLYFDKNSFWWDR